jgi:hypothetical protein
VLDSKERPTILGGLVASAISILFLEDESDDSNQDGVTAEDIFSFVNVARRHQNQGTGKQRRYKNHERACWAELRKTCLLFNDKQFERVFHSGITWSISERVLTECALLNPFFWSTFYCTGKPSICPKVKLLMGLLKCLCFATSPVVVFMMNYFQICELKGRMGTEDYFPKCCTFR